MRVMGGGNFYGNPRIRRKVIWVIWVKFVLCMLWICCTRIVYFLLHEVKQVWQCKTVCIVKKYIMYDMRYNAYHNYNTVWGGILILSWIKWLSFWDKKMTMLSTHHCLPHNCMQQSKLPYIEVHKSRVH